MRAHYSAQAWRIQRISVLRSGGFPYINRPMVKTFAAHHTDTTTDPAPMTIVSHTCHAGGGALEVRRSSIAKVFTGGMKLIAVLNAEFGPECLPDAPQAHRGVHVAKTIVSSGPGCSRRPPFR